ncbi:MAG: ACT domain-containing protein [Anaerolineales bacterium]|nr:ACT domain-containing protein [Anaerolineales bacterium]
MALQLTVLPGIFTVVRLPAVSSIPGWLEESDWVSVTRTAEELSIVCKDSSIPKDFAGTIESGWHILKILGPLDFSLVGVLAKISGILADAEISVFVISTFDTDYILLKENSLVSALSLLTNTGYVIV